MKSLFDFIRFRVNTTFTAIGCKIRKRMNDWVLSAICGEHPLFLSKEGIAFVHISRYAPLDSFLVGCRALLWTCFGGAPFLRTRLIDLNNKPLNLLRRLYARLKNLNKYGFNFSPLSSDCRP
jgi:hypothetical protein